MDRVGRLPEDTNARSAIENCGMFYGSAVLITDRSGKIFEPC